MKQSILIFICCVAMMSLFTACKQEVATNTLTIEGTIKNIENSPSSSLFLEKVTPTGMVELARQDLQAGGNFSFKLPLEGAKKELYRLKIANKLVFLSNEDDSKHIKVDADLSAGRGINYTVEGSPASTVAQKLYSAILNLRANTFHYKEAINSAYPYTAAYFANKYLVFSNATRPIHQAAADKLKAAYPTHPLVANYETYIKEKSQLQSKVANRAGGVQVGQDAPDITLPNPKGEMIQLSSLKGKVVVVDFWASWCGPCRKYGNPKLVELHKKYKNEDFAIFNVALERSRGNNNKRWTDAIEKDGLVWPYHVVDTKREFSPIYGASRIPRVYLVDKEGKIAAVNPQGAALDNKIKELLKG